MKRRILHKIKLTEISGVDRPCVEDARVAILKREPEPVSPLQARIDALRAKIAKTFDENKHPRAHDGKFTSGGGSTPSSTTSSVSSPSVTPEARDATLEWLKPAVYTALGGAKAATWAPYLKNMYSAFWAALPLGGRVAMGAAAATLFTPGALALTAAAAGGFYVLETALDRLIEHRESELAKAAPDDDRILATLKAMRAALIAQKESDQMDNDLEKSGYGADFDALVEAEVLKGCPRSVAGQRVLQIYGAAVPSSAQIRKSESVVADFAQQVDRVVIEKRCSRTAAMSEVRRRDPAAFAKYQRA
jgi:hypothetical protein